MYLPHREYVSPPAGHAWKMGDSDRGGRKGVSLSLFLNPPIQSLGESAALSADEW